MDEQWVKIRKVCNDFLAALSALHDVEATGMDKATALLEAAEAKGTVAVGQLEELGGWMAFLDL